MSYFDDLLQYGNCLECGAVVTGKMVFCVNCYRERRKANQRSAKESLAKSAKESEYTYKVTGEETYSKMKRELR